MIGKCIVYGQKEREEGVKQDTFQSYHQDDCSNPGCDVEKMQYSEVLDRMEN